MEPHLSSLNIKQREAVLATEGPVLIVAGAGAGKTKTMTHRMLHLIKNGVPAYNILAITFTNKAAREMKERITGLLNPDAPRGEKSEVEQAPHVAVPFVSTFHALGVHIMKQNAERLGLPRFFGIYDRNDTKRIVKDILTERGYDPKQHDPAKILYAISAEKGKFVNAEQYAEKMRGGNGTGNGGFAGGQTGLVAMVWPEYEKRLRAEKAVDLDDLLLVTANLLTKHADVREYYQKLWKYIHVDEYQDTNAVQYEIVKLLAEKSRNICVVGDTDQNIYSWRGADISNMLRFEKDYPEAKVILLEENYRSTQTIIAVANAVIAKNKMRIEKNLFTRNVMGEKIGMFEAWSESQEAFFVINKIKELASGLDMYGNKVPKVPLNEIAVLYRANFQSRILEEAFVAEGMKYSMVGTKFFERKEIKDVISYLRAALNPEAFADIRRVINVPTRGIGEKTIEKVQEKRMADITAGTRIKVEKFYALLETIRVAAREKVPSEVIKYVMTATGIEDMLKKGNEQDQERIENIRELVTLAKRYDTSPVGEGIELLIADAALAAAEESPEDTQPAVKLMTVHASKGLEFDYVFITGLEQGLFPHERMGGSHSSRGNSDADEEERRLFYVALTRARTKLFLSYATMRTVFGERRVTMPSEFLSDIEPGYTELEFITAPADGPKHKRIIEF